MDVKLVSKVDSIGRTMDVKLMSKATPAWTSHLPEHDSMKEEERYFINTIEWLALSKPHEITDKTSLNVKGKNLYCSMYFLTKKKEFATASQLLKILKLRGHGRCKVQLNMEYCKLPFHILDLDSFQYVAIMAVNYIPSTIKEHKGGNALMLDIFYHLFDFIKVKSPNSVVITRTAYMLMKNIHFEVDMHLLERIILSTANMFITLKPYAKAVDYVDRMSNIIIKRWSKRRLNAEFDSLCQMPSWENYDCYLMSRVLNNWSSDVFDFKQVELLAKRIGAMLTERNLISGAIKVIGATLNHVHVITWTTFFVPYLTREMPKGVERAKAYMKNTLSECASLSVKRYGGSSALQWAIQLQSHYSYSTLVIYCGVQQGRLDLFMEEIDLCKVLEDMSKSCFVNVRYYALKIFCIFNNKRAELGPWHLNCVSGYLDNNRLHFDIDSIKDLHYFFSHLCVKANSIIPNETAELNLYVEFLDFICNYCMLLITTKDPKQIIVGVQIFNLVRFIFEGDSHCLKLKYKLPKDEHYDKKQAPFFQLLTSRSRWKFTEIDTWNIIHLEFMNSEKVYPEIAELVLKWCEDFLPRSQNDTSRIFFEGITLLRTRYDNESIEKGCYSIRIGLADKTVSDKLHCLLMKAIEEDLLSQQFQMCHYAVLVDLLTKTSLFGLTKCISCLFQFKNRATSYIFITQAFVFCDSHINRVMHCISTDEEQTFYSSPNKLVEQFLIACLDVLTLAVKFDWNQSGDALFKIAVETANMIIETSNMKRPVITAAILVRQLCLEVLTSGHSTSEVIIIKFLEYVLFSIYAAPTSLTSTIRRNPEHRLIIHAIVVADQRPNHPFLARAMEFLLGVLSDPTSMSGSVASALHTVEIILSENSMRMSTLPFVSSVLVHSINAFSTMDWQIKNAAIQVLRALIDRILGQKTNLIYRYHTIEDVFLLFPEIGIYFYSKLQDAHYESVDDSIIAILSIFSESHRKCSEFVCKNVKTVTECFLRIFLNFLCSNTTTVGIFAAKAYAALYPHLFIPFIIRDIVDCLMTKFCEMKKNMFYTYICLLQALYQRFNIFSYVSYHKLGLSIIESSIQSLTLFLEKFNETYEFSLYSLLSITSNSVVNIEESVMCQLQSHTYQSRLWLNNNVPYLLNHVEVKKFPAILNTCLSGTFSSSLKIHCLRAVTNRYHGLIENSVVDATLLVLIKLFFELEFTNDYLLISYSNVMLLLFEVCDITLSEDLLSMLRVQYKKVSTSNIYFVSVYVCLLSQIKTYTETDQIFIKDAITVYRNSTVTEDYELNFHVASTLKYLYKCVEISDRHEVLKLAFFLLLNEETAFEISKFVSHTFDLPLSSTWETIEVLISHEHLLKHLGAEIRVCNFLIDLTVLIASLKNGFEFEGNFYYKKNSDICLHKHSLKKMLLEKVKYAFRIIPRNSCRKLLCNLSYVISFN